MNGCTPKEDTSAIGMATGNADQVAGKQMASGQTGTSAATPSRRTIWDVIDSALQKTISAIKKPRGAGNTAANAVTQNNVTTVLPLSTQTPISPDVEIAPPVSVATKPSVSFVRGVYSIDPNPFASQMD